MVKIAELLEENARLRELLVQSQVAIRELVEQVARLNDRVAELVVIAARKQRASRRSSHDPRRPSHGDAVSHEPAPLPGSPQPPARCACGRPSSDGVRRQAGSAG